MTDLQTRTTLARRTDIPEWLVVQEMDRAKRVIEDTLRIHDTLARELGYERVRCEQIQPGDVIVNPYSCHEVRERVPQVDPSGFHHWLVRFTDGTNDVLMPDQFVSRQLPISDETTEPF